jgi:hypothetical protein
MRERFGKPQLIAGMLLLVFLAQCSWLVSQSLRSGAIEESEWYRLDAGLRMWRGAPQALSSADPQIHAAPPPQIRENEGIGPDHSELWYLVASLPLLFWPGSLQSQSLPYWGWLARAPALLFGVLLGASLWYVARRLYGNAGGFIALTLYCFSPGIIRASAGWFAEPETGAAWGAFGAIFTAIAVAHTLYAPREVLLWNWRRIVLLAISLALGIGSQYSLFVLVPLTLGFVLYLAPARRGAAAVIWAVACTLALVILFAAYGFRLHAFEEALGHAAWLPVTRQALGMASAYRALLAQLGESSPALLLTLPLSLVIFLAWPRARYFGNVAPLLVGGLFLLLGLANPHYPGLGFQFVSVPFLFVFVAGITADLLESRYRDLVMASTFGVLSAYALWSLFELGRVAPGL